MKPTQTANTYVYILQSEEKLPAEQFQA